MVYKNGIKDLNLSGVTDTQILYAQSTLYHTSADMLVFDYNLIQISVCFCLFIALLNLLFDLICDQVALQVLKLFKAFKVFKGYSYSLLTAFVLFKVFWMWCCGWADSVSSRLFWWALCKDRPAQYGWTQSTYWSLLVCLGEASLVHILHSRHKSSSSTSPTPISSYFTLVAMETSGPLSPY